MRISYWSSDVCSSDLAHRIGRTRLVERQFARTRDHRHRRAQLVAAAVDERALALDEALVTGEVVVDRVGDHHQLGTRARAHGHALAAAVGPQRGDVAGQVRSEEHTSELQSLMRNSYAVFCLKKTTS